ncbi:IS21 family transposase ISHahy12 [subsurface metagenome]
MDEKIIEMLKYIRLWGLLANWDRYNELARKENFSHVRLLKYIITEEYKIKKENSRKMRLSRAKIPEKFVMETFPFDRQQNLNKKKILNIYDSFDYMTKNQNVVWIGATGTGKTGLATAFLMQAINEGCSGRFILFPELIEMLYQSVADHSEANVINKFASYDCLLIDELGYVEVEPVQVGLFFTLMHKRHKKKTTLITSNLGFQQWNSFLKNDHLAAALIDRLTENSHVINMKDCVSLRPKLDSM